MTSLAQQCSDDGENIPVDQFCELLESIVLLLRGMGSMMSTAFSDVAEKAEIMRRNKKFMLELLQKAHAISLNATIDEEIALGVIECNGDNNKKKLDKSKYISWEGTYNSTGRNLVRMWWLTKFLTKLLDNLINQHNLSLVSSCQDAYTAGFADHHPWLVRKGAGLAMMAAGQKEALIAKWGVTNVEEARPALEHFTKLRDQLHQLLSSRNLLDLP
eukprot:CAMPEP_0170469690 /NCGR_PEP_ID=MMETSP0123-20130129/12440_1 /TAXON_ID=182087 /ORGANISM="Favella ehrenbergii, Strain Fehren 1" /LENGTH=215 /DNA_ID=CAMNT_0010736651 /DNA_START=52 /DNA_END=699 /DNA_ORIENTATION=+